MMSDPARAALEREYESIQWIWRVVMGFAMVAAAQEVYVGFCEPLLLRAFGEHGEVDLLCGLLFVALFVPAHLLTVVSGNRYIHLRQQVQYEQPSWRFADLPIMILQGILFIFLARALPNALVFLCVLATLQALALGSWMLFAVVAEMPDIRAHLIRHTALLLIFLGLAVGLAWGLLDLRTFIAAGACVLGLSILAETHWTMRRYFAQAMVFVARPDQKP